MEEIERTNNKVKLCGKRKRDMYEGVYVYKQTETETDTINTLENGVKFLFIYENLPEKKVEKQNE